MMPLATGERTAVRCRNCDARAGKLGRLAWLTPSGKLPYLSVCRYCYAQLQRRQKAIIRR